MEQLLTFEFEQVQNSIVTPDSIFYGDYIQPYSFIEFLKNTNNNYTPKVYNEFYLEYISRWQQVKGTLNIDTQTLVRNQYIDLMREISLTYSSAQERRFLSNINFNDPEDLEIAIPFFSRKIKEIVLLYKSSRDKLTFQIEKNKRKGTESSVQLALRENIINFLQSSDRFASLNIELSSVNSNVKIKLDELVDTYGNYFDLPYNPPADYNFGGVNRDELYTSNINDIDYRYFIDLDGFLKKYVYDRVFIEELGKNFTINLDIAYDPVCDPTNIIGEYIEQISVAGITPESYRQLRERLVKKFIGVDYNFVVKNGVGEVLTGTLFEADNPSGNLLNVNSVSTATVLSNELKSLRKIGLYFAPEKQNIIKFNKTTNTYAIDFDKLTPNVTYVFPNPDLYGKNYSSDYPLIFYYDPAAVTRRLPNTNTYGDPVLDPRAQNFFAYYSRQQTYDTENINEYSLKTAFTSLYDLGYIQDWKQDVYGNEYGLMKDKYGQFFTNTYTLDRIIDKGSLVKFLPFNGWLFNDPLSGANFDYYTSGTYEEFNGVVKSGIALSGGNFTDTAVDQYLNFRQFVPYAGIPSRYNLYPTFGFGSLQRGVSLSGSRTIRSGLTGNDEPKLLSQRESLSGTIFVRNANSGVVESLSSALSATFSKYSQQIKTQLYNQVKGFDVYYDNIIIRTDNYVVFDKVNFTNEGFIKPQTFNLYISTNPTDPFDRVSNMFFEPSKNNIVFYKTAVLSAFENDNGKILYPEIYRLDTGKSKLVKIFPSKGSPINAVSSNFTFYNIYSTINIVEVDSCRISHNENTDQYVINFIGYDSNKSPYIFDHKFTYDGEEVYFNNSNFYKTNSYKEVSNFHTLSQPGFVFVNIIPGNNVHYYTPINFSISATGFNTMTLNNRDGYLQLWAL